MSKLTIGSRPVVKLVFSGLWSRGLRHGARDVEQNLVWERVWPYLDPWDSVRLRTASTHWNVPGKYRPMVSALFFLLK